MIASDAGAKCIVGRPNVKIKPEQVRELKNQDVSWRRIAKSLGIGTATAMRLLKSIDELRPNTQDARPEAPGQVE